jgi:hypothetical protein
MNPDPERHWIGGLLCLAAAPTVAPGLPAQGTAKRAPDERRGFDTQASRYPRLHTTREEESLMDAVPGEFFPWTFS